MADEVQKGIGQGEELRSFARKLWAKLVYEVGISKPLLRAYGVDPKLFHYYFHSEVSKPRKREQFIEHLIEIVRTEYPGLKGVIEDLEKYLEMIRKRKL